MKKIQVIVIIAVFFVSIQLFAQKKGYDLNWQTNFETAKELAEKDEKLILLYFTGSDWSKASENLNKDFFYTEKFKKLADKHLVLMRVDAPRRRNLISEFQTSSNDSLSKKYHQKVYPTVVLTDAEGKELGKIESYNYLHDTSEHYGLIEKALKKRSK